MGDREVVLRNDERRNKRREKSVADAKWQPLEAKPIALVGSDDDFDVHLTKRRTKFEKLVAKNCAKEIVVDVTFSSELNGGSSIGNDKDEDDGVDADLSSESVSDVETVSLPPPLQLSSSSGTIGVPEPSVSHLFSIYGFLRSFSTQLFLHPFTLDEFVGALN
ncbi:PHD finger family protein, partial [Trifolium pratense]